MKRNVHVKPEVKAAFEAKRNECVTIARQRSGKDIPMFPLVFSQMGRRAGVCATDLLAGESTVKVNPDYFSKNYNEQLNDTLPHEVAHAVVDFLYPLIKPTDGLSELAALMSRRRRRVDPHGSEWFEVMGWFGIPNPSIRHKMDMTGVAVRKKVARPFNYKCNCGLPHPLTLRLHKQIQENGKKRFCKNCRQVIVYERQWGKPVKTRVKVPVVIPLVAAIPKEPEPQATHKTVTRFINGTLQNVRIPLTTEQTAI